MKKGFIAAGFTLMFIGIVLLVGALINLGWDITKLSTVSCKTVIYSPDDSFKNIEICSGDADIRIKPSTDGKLSVVCNEQEKIKHTVSVENGVLKIGFVDDRAWIDHISLSPEPMLITVFLTQTEYDSLLIEDGSGDIIIDTDFIFGSADIKSDTGDVSCFATLKGQLNVDTGTGDIVSENMSAGNISFSVSTGKIDLNNAGCNDTITLSTNTGDVKLSNVTCKNLFSRGDTGDIILKEVIASERFDIERNTGDVTFEKCDAGAIDIRTSVGDVTGTLRSEKEFSTKTSTGTVRTPGTGSGGKCTVTTSTGDILIELSPDTALQKKSFKSAAMICSF